MLDVLAAISVIWFLAHLSPGPDFLVTVRVAMTQTRAAALRTVGGITVGTVIWCIAGFFGIHALFASTPGLYLALKYAGGAYLVGENGPELFMPRQGGEIAAPSAGAINIHFHLNDGGDANAIAINQAQIAAAIARAVAAGRRNL